MPAATTRTTPNVASFLADSIGARGTIRPASMWGMAGGRHIPPGATIAGLFVPRRAHHCAISLPQYVGTVGAGDDTMRFAIGASLVAVMHVACGSENVSVTYTPTGPVLLVERELVELENGD